MFVVELSFPKGPGTQRAIKDEIDAVRHAVDWALQFPTCTVNILRDGQLYLGVQRGDDSGIGRRLAPDLIAFLRSRITTA